MDPKYKPLMIKRKENVNNVDVQEHIPSHLINVIPDIDLLRRLLNIGLLSAEVEDRPGAYYQRRTGVPKLSYHTYPSRRLPVRNEPK